MRRSDGVAGVFRFPRIRRYQRCLCGQLFPVLAIAGRPPVVCRFHRRPDGTYRSLRRRLALKRAG